MNTTESDPDNEGSLIEHLIELRTRLIRSLVGLGLVLVILLPFAHPLFDWLSKPLRAQLPESGRLVAVGIVTPFFTPIQLAFFAALFIAAPWVIYQLWAFVAPGLYRKEKKLAIPLLVSALLLFYVGCAFAFFIVLPSVFHFLALVKPDSVTLMPDIEAYLKFVMVVFLAFGISFELPIAMIVLTVLGWVTPDQLKRGRGYAIVGIFILAAIITPPDIVSQLMLALPMCLLYEIGIIAARLAAKRQHPVERPS